MIKTKGARVLDIEITKSKLESDVHISAIISLQLEKRGQNGEVLNLLSRGEGVRAVEEL
jgi:hypothetical protein